MCLRMGHLLQAPHPPLSQVNSVSASLFIAFCELQTVMTWRPVYLQYWRGEASGFTLCDVQFLNRGSLHLIPLYLSWLIIFATDEAVVSSEGLVISLTYCLHHCYKQVSCSRLWGWLSRLSAMVDLCADMSFRINQAYRTDRCLFTCYKHLPRLALAPSPHRLFTRIRPPYSGRVYSRAAGLI